LWAIVVSVISAYGLLLVRRDTEPAAAVRALRITSACGLAVSIGLAAYSASIGILCPTCLAFYILAAIAAWISYRHFAGPNTPWKFPLLLAGGSLFIGYGILLYPGIHTPMESELAGGVPADQAGPNRKLVDQSEQLGRFLASQSAELQQYISNYLAEYRDAQQQSIPDDPERLTFGTENSPVHLVEWLEITCPHCRHLEENLTRIRSITAPGSWNVETRFFPLDSECNALVRHSRGTHVSCLAARLLICLSGTPQANRVREALFEHQQQLTNTDTVWQIAEQQGVQRESAEPCTTQAQTEAQLQNDIRLANRYNISGTPLVVMNGREVAALPHLILALILAGGNDHDPAFDVLPPPQPIKRTR